jgi:hypothetical protein
LAAFVRNERIKKSADYVTDIRRIENSATNFMA